MKLAGIFYEVGLVSAGRSDPDLVQNQTGSATLLTRNIYTKIYKVNLCTPTRYAITSISDITVRYISIFFNFIQKDSE
jgi:hypothetical protein